VISGKKLIDLFRRFAVSGFVVWCLYVAAGTGISVRAKWDPNFPFNNPVDIWEGRVVKILDYLPDNVTLVGYAADWDIPGVAYNPIDQDAEYVITQYALAPIMVKPGLDHEWIIGNFTDPGFSVWLDEKITEYEIESLGYGIYLIHRSSP